MHGVRGDELFSFSKSQLEKFCGKDEGHRLDSQLSVQKSISGVSANLVPIAYFCFWMLELGLFNKSN